MPSHPPGLCQRSQELLSCYKSHTPNDSPTEAGQGRSPGALMPALRPQGSWEDSAWMAKGSLKPVVMVTGCNKCLGGSGSLYGKESTHSGLDLLFIMDSGSLPLLVFVYISSGPHLDNPNTSVLTFMALWLFKVLSIHQSFPSPSLEKGPGKRYTCWTPQADGGSCVSIQHGAPAFRV